MPGSSPRVRGFVGRRRAGSLSAGFIPACAGFWSAQYPNAGVDEVHPRVCGVLGTLCFTRRTLSGSSPRVRGFVRAIGQRRLEQRFIPACAGFCKRWNNCRGLWRVHPRVCGVLLAAGLRFVRPLGSSPRVRGFGAIAKPRSPAERFIPACAGFWRSFRRARSRRWVHPRVCGVLLKIAEMFSPL